jgi:hypothetical protein
MIMRVGKDATPAGGDRTGGYQLTTHSQVTSQAKYSRRTIGKAAARRGEMAFKAAR